VREALPSRRLQIRFVGTSAQPEGEDRLGLQALAGEAGVGDLFQLEPRRVPYLDALRTMQDADLLLLPGSTDAHYTASRIFPAWLARKPVLALFHAASTVIALARELGGVRVIAYDDQAGPETRAAVTAAAIGEIVRRNPAAVPPRNEAAFGPYAARGVAQRYAALFDRVLAARRGP
jgi:hypothetical protein